MEARVPSFFMLAPGPWRNSEEVIEALQRGGITASELDDEPIQPGDYRVDLVVDRQLADGFSWGREGPLRADLVARVGQCGAAALIQCGHRLDENPAGTARLGRALRDAGGVAVRMEASGAASAWETWLEHLEAGTATGLYACATLIAEGERGARFTCGMHQFELPDAQIALSDPAEALAWLDAFCVYQLEEQPVLASGHRFQPTSRVAPRTFERWPDDRHDDSDGRHNPFGVWRFLQPGENAIEPCELAMMFVPSLVATLMAAEQKQSRRLTRPEVERIVSGGQVIAMTRADALALERARGYADIEPERAWEQWQIVRSPHLTLVR